MKVQLTDAELDTFKAGRTITRNILAQCRADVPSRAIGVFVEPTSSGIKPIQHRYRLMHVVSAEMALIDVDGSTAAFFVVEYRLQTGRNRAIEILRQEGLNDFAEELARMSLSESNDD